MVNGERGGRGSRTVPVTVDEPVLVPMSEAERAAAVSALVGILATWWSEDVSEDRDDGEETRSAKP